MSTDSGAKQLRDDNASAKSTSRLATFIVEDSAVIRENLIAALEELAPISVVGTAEDEGSALRWLGAHGNECDLVILDIFLSSGSGLGVLKGAANLNKTFRFVVLSNHCTPEVRTECMRRGASVVFDKSNEFDSLLAYCHRTAQPPQLHGTMPRRSGDEANTWHQ
jgi:DNA-binding NarL/FixJ family response regulator